MLHNPCFTKVWERVHRYLFSKGCFSYVLATKHVNFQQKISFDTSCGASQNIFTGRDGAEPGRYFNRSICIENFLGRICGFGTAVVKRFRLHVSGLKHNGFLLTQCFKAAAEPPKLGRGQRWTRDFPCKSYRSADLSERRIKVKQNARSGQNYFYWHLSSKPR